MPARPGGEVVASAFLEDKRGDVVAKRVSARPEQELLPCVTVTDCCHHGKVGLGSGKPFLGEDRTHSDRVPLLRLSGWRVRVMSTT